MKRFLPLGVILLALAGALFLAHRQQVATQPSAYPLVSAAAEAQREATRVPARLDPLSDEEEIRIGDELAGEYAASGPRQKSTEAYLQRVGERVASRARRRLPWHFHYLADTDFVNAFALPGGHVFVGAGLLRLMDSEDALAAVLGHEVEHIDLRHCAERVQTEANLRKLDLLGAVLSLPVQIFEAGYTKQQEIDADRDGTTLAVEAGYSPQGILHLMEEFRKMEGEVRRSPGSPVEEAGQLTAASLQGYFQSHPPAQEREAQIRALIEENHWPSPPLRPLDLPR